MESQFLRGGYLAKYVYKDKKRTEVIYAKDALREDKDITYYCPNPNCNAHMYLCGVDGVSSAYFSATRKAYPHCKGCNFETSNNFNTNNFDETAFDFENVLEMMRMPSMSSAKKKALYSYNTNNSDSKPLKTIRQVYDMCKSFPCSDSYNNLDIGQMLLDDRSEYMYPKGVFGNRLIEAKVKKGSFYNANKMKLSFVAPSSEKYELQLQFEDKDLFNIIKNNLYNNRHKLIVLSGLWEASEKYNIFSTKIVSKKQIAIIN